MFFFFFVLRPGEIHYALKKYFDVCVHLSELKYPPDFLEPGEK